MTQQLSPAAQAVLDAFLNGYMCSPCSGVAFEADRNAVAAALRAASDQVVPEVANDVGDEHDEARRDQWLRIRCKFLAIAAELDGASNTSENVLDR